ncbi:MAG: phosphoribosylformylglycinamidine synthase subunit PurL [Bacteroidales bacterium]|jgi:phosphoribosylformylglycinamidine synthase|nr:phosphoribosylformylglycinamidine synthase subunit PurL [Bacteroidales bacterium]MDD4385086.1 phosphoribosylformylglycinamidine synthase subunit PurL [Bacteroidales bacterium]MDY0196397.1 phosphoribosylformylglycinamidine synthase subunit PurL [Tenuifilaceae bacterium]
MEVTLDIAKELGLLPSEFEMIKKILGRTPNYTELSIFSVMWSEHASYKNSIKWIKTLPRKGDAILAEAGTENAGLVDIGDGLACAFKIESHNHPCAVEPYQGAATGVGGINRDIFTMGARPIAQLNSLRFGNIKLDKTKWHIKGVVKGIGDYGNAFGVPVVAGEVFFDDSYNTNPLVNAMSVGIVEKDMVISAISEGAGNPVFIVGSSTGKDGIHGTTFASANITEDSADDIPSIQVGDPFMEKLLLEASLEVIKTGALVGMQDMGAAGIICSTSEMSEKGGHGMRVDLSKVPLRQQNMEPFEILLSESQERMLIVVKKGREAEVEKVYKKWDLNCVQIAEVTEGGRLEFFWKGEKVADVPAESLVLGGGAPVYDREYTEPAYYKEYKQFDINQVPEPADLKEVAKMLINHPNIASKRWIYEQYDSMVGTTNMVTNFPSAAGVVNLKGTNKALVLSVDCNPRYVKADPMVGAMIAVAESARNIVCTGGKPLAITNCLNFGNPYKPEIYWQFVNAIKGMSMACEKFGTPVTGGNVSFYNQSNIGGKDEAVFPTPTIGMLGLLDNKNHHTTLAFKDKGHMIYLIGKSHNDIASSEYLNSFHGIKKSPAPYFNLDEEYQTQQLVMELISLNLIQSANDVSDGGLYVSLLESAMPRNLGFDITTDAEIRSDAFLFGEAQGRIVVSVSQTKETHFIDYMVESKIPFTALGHVTKSEIRVDDVSFGFVVDMKREFDNALGEQIVGK